MGICLINTFMYVGPSCAYANFSEELSIVAKFVWDMPGNEHPDNTSSDAVDLVRSQRSPAQGPSRTGLEAFAKRELFVRFDELDTNFGTCRVASFSPR